MISKFSYQSDLVFAFSHSAFSQVANDYSNFINSSVFLVEFDQTQMEEIVDVVKNVDEALLVLNKAKGKSFHFPKVLVVGSQVCHISC